MQASLLISKSSYAGLEITWATSMTSPPEACLLDPKRTETEEALTPSQQ